MTRKDLRTNDAIFRRTNNRNLRTAPPPRRTFNGLTALKYLGIAVVLAVALIHFMR